MLFHNSSRKKLRKNVLDVETDVVTRLALNELLVMHFDGLDFSSHVGRSEGDNHAGLDDTSFDTTDGHRADTTDLVDILEGKAKGLVGGTDRGLDGVDGVEEGLALDDTSLRLLRPALVPWHTEHCLASYQMTWPGRIHSLAGLLQHVVTMPARNRDERNCLRVVTNLLNEVGNFLYNFVETILRPLIMRTSH